MLELAITILVIGVIWYVAVTVIPLPQPVLIVLNVIFGLIIVVLLLQSFGLLSFSNHWLKC